ncbi:MAG: hypothetical protein GY941_19580 [Planctomycetes bacterium]|nr:hypothetical protein [Planctomycetota bacterium]
MTTPPPFITSHQHPITDTDDIMFEALDRLLDVSAQQQSMLSQLISRVQTLEATPKPARRWFT